MFISNPIAPGSIVTADIAPGAVTLVQTDFMANPLPIAAGGTGASSAGLVAGANIVVSGAWPDQTLALASIPSVAHLVTTDTNTAIVGALNVGAGNHVRLNASLSVVAPPGVSAGQAWEVIDTSNNVVLKVAIDGTQTVTLGVPLAVASGGSGTATPALVAGTAIGITGAWPNQIITNTSAYAILADPLPVAHGGSGTATPALVAGSNVTITGSWPDQTIALTSTPSVTGLIITGAPPNITFGGRDANGKGVSLDNFGNITIAAGAAAADAWQVFDTNSVSAFKVVLGGGAAVTFAGKIASYNALSTEGNGVPSILVNMSATSQGASALVWTFTPPVTGMYRISVYLLALSAQTGHQGVFVDYDDAFLASAASMPVFVTNTGVSLDEVISATVTIIALGGHAIQLSIDSTTQTTFDVASVLEVL